MKLISVIAAMAMMLTACGSSSSEDEDENADEGGSGIHTIAALDGMCMENEISFIVSDDLIDLIYPLLEEELGDEADYAKEILTLVNDLSVKADVSFKDNKMALVYALCAKNDSLLSYRTYFDNDNGVLFLEFPEISDKAVYVDFGAALAEAIRTNPEFADALNQINEYANDEKLAELIDRALNKVLANSLEKYITAAINGLGGTEESGVKLEAGGVSETCTVITYTINEKTLTNAAAAVLDEIKKDEDLLDLLDDVEQYLLDKDLIDEEVNVRGTLLDTIDEAKDELDELERELKSTFRNMDITAKLYISGDDSLAGISVNVENRGDSVEAFLLSAEDGKDVGTEIGVRMDGREMFLFSGAGKRSGDELNGDYTFSVMGTELVSLNVADFDTKACADGILKGTFTFTPEDSLYEMIFGRGFSNTSGLSSEEKAIADLITSLALRVKADGDANSSDVKITVISGDKDMLGVRFKTKISGADKISLPNKDDSIDFAADGASEAWADSIDLEKFAEKILDKLGVSKDLEEFLLSLTSEIDDEIDLPDYDNFGGRPTSGSSDSHAIPDDEAERLAVDYVKAMYLGEPEKADGYCLVSTEELLEYVVELNGSTLKEYLNDYYGANTMSEYWSEQNEMYKEMLEDEFGRNLSITVSDISSDPFSASEIKDFHEEYEDIFDDLGLDVSRVTAATYVSFTVEVSGSKSSDSTTDGYTLVQYNGDWSVFNLF